MNVMALREALEDLPDEMVVVLEVGLDRDGGKSNAQELWMVHDDVCPLVSGKAVEMIHGEHDLGVFTPLYAPASSDHPYRVLRLSAGGTNEPMEKRDD